MALEKLNVGIIGIGGRPATFVDAILAHDRARLAAICDVSAAALEKAGARLDAAMEKAGAPNAGRVARFTDYKEMIAGGHVDAVVVGTPMPYHAEQCVFALENGVHALCEVTPAVSIAECKAITVAARASKAAYMMAENGNYFLNNMIVSNIAEAGLMGDLYYAESEYVHNCMSIIETTPWRGKWLYGRRGLTYGTHCLGPILGWFKGDRVTEVTFAGTGNHFKAPSGADIVADDSITVLCRTAMGRLINVRVDLTPQRPYCMTYVLNGTKGCYNSSRYSGDKDNIYLGDGGIDVEKWCDWDDVAAKHMPDAWTKRAAKNDKNSADFVLMSDFLDAVCAGTPVPIGVDFTMDMALPGLVTQEFADEASRGWVAVPDSRDW